MQGIIVGMAGGLVLVGLFALGGSSISANVLASNHSAQALVDWIRQEEPALWFLLEVNATWLKQLAPLHE